MELITDTLIQLFCHKPNQVYGHYFPQHIEGYFKLAYSIPYEKRASDLIYY